MLIYVLKKLENYNIVYWDLNRLIVDKLMVIKFYEIY